MSTETELLQTIKSQTDDQIKGFKEEITQITEDLKKGLITEAQFDEKFKEFSEK